MIIFIGGSRSWADFWFRSMSGLGFCSGSWSESMTWSRSSSESRLRSKSWFVVGFGFEDV